MVTNIWSFTPCERSNTKNSYMVKDCILLSRFTTFLFCPNWFLLNTHGSLAVWSVLIFLLAQSHSSMERERARWWILFLSRLWVGMFVVLSCRMMSDTYGSSSRIAMKSYRFRLATLDEQNIEILFSLDPSWFFLLVFIKLCIPHKHLVRLTHMRPKLIPNLA